MMWVLIVILIGQSPYVTLPQVSVAAFTQEFADQEHCIDALNLISKSLGEQKKIAGNVFACVPKGPA